MHEEHRQIAVPGQGRVSSVWTYAGGVGATAVILAHGAGNDMQSPFLVEMHERWADAGLLAVRFNFPYKESGRRLPDPTRVLLDTWRAVTDTVASDPDYKPERVFLAGKSMGGRIASVLASEGKTIDGLIFLGYPLHPAGKPETIRGGHLKRVECPMLFIQGTRDRLCDLDLLRHVTENLEHAQLRVIEGGDHSFNVLKKMHREPGEVWAEIAGQSLEFMQKIVSETSP